MNSKKKSNNEKSKYTQIKSKDIFKNLKSDYFLVKMLDNLNKKKILDIIKYNKNIKNRINININDYKDYSEKNSSIEIEIEIIPDYSKYFRNFSGKYYFIDADKEKYYHIFFNNNTKEIKRCYINKGENVERIKVIINNPDSSLRSLFYRCKWNKSINFKYLEGMI